MRFSKKLLFLLLVSSAQFSFAAAPAPEIKKSQLPLPANSESFNVIRVLVQKQTDSLELGTEAPYKIYDENQRLLFGGERIALTPVRATPDGLQLGRQAFRTEVLRVEAGGKIMLGNKKYHDTLEIFREGQAQVKAVSEVSLEEYLKGVLPVEVSPKWPLETLKAHAVISRTYAIFSHLEKAEEKKYAVTADVSSQVYGGAGAHRPETDSAVDATRGQILVYKGKIFPAYFHSTCGGHTTRADKVWPVEKHPSLMGVACDFCQGSKHYRWSAALTLKQIESRLKKNGFNVSGVKALSLGSTDKTGHVETFFVHDSSGRKKISANGFRLFMGPMDLKSTVISSFKRVGDEYRFTGKGWGHGVGLCQYGAKKLGELGYTYRQILAFYYPQSSLTQVSSVS